jgi:hypothetical protein
LLFSLRSECCNCNITTQPQQNNPPVRRMHRG